MQLGPRCLSLCYCSLHGHSFKPTGLKFGMVHLWVRDCVFSYSRSASAASEAKRGHTWFMVAKTHGRNPKLLSDLDLGEPDDLRSKTQFCSISQIWSIWTLFTSLTLLIVWPHLWPLRSTEVSWGHWGQKFNFPQFFNYYPSEQLSWTSLTLWSPWPQLWPLSTLFALWAKRTTYIHSPRAWRASSPRSGREFFYNFFHWK